MIIKGLPLSLALQYLFPPSCESFLNVSLSDLASAQMSHTHDTHTLDPAQNRSFSLSLTHTLFPMHV